MISASRRISNVTTADVKSVKQIENVSHGKILCLLELKQPYNYLMHMISSDGELS